MKHDWDVYAIPRNPHLKTSSRGAEAPTCPETSPWPTRSYAIAWFRRLYLEQSQPDHLDSTFRRGHRNPPDFSQFVQTEWFQCPLPAPVTALPGWNRRESHRPAVPAEFLPIKFVHAGLGIRIKRQLPRWCVHRQHAIHTAAGLCKHLALLVSVAPKETRTHNDIPLDQLELLISGKENQNEIIR